LILFAVYTADAALRYLFISLAAIFHYYRRQILSHRIASHRIAAQFKKTLRKITTK
jgi:hypothetical protein